MTNKNLLLFVLVLLFGALSLYLNRDRFRAVPLQISDRSMPSRGTRASTAAVNPVIFLFNKGFRIQTLKVFLAADAQTNKFPHPIWNLVSDSNSVPIKEFPYGHRIAGMHPAVKGVGADPLQPGVTYRLLVEGASEKAEHDFTPVPLSN